MKIELIIFSLPILMAEKFLLTIQFLNLPNEKIKMLLRKCLNTNQIEPLPRQ